MGGMALWVWVNMGWNKLLFPCWWKFPLDVNRTCAVLFAFQNKDILSAGWFAALEGDCCSMWISALVFSSVKDKVDFSTAVCVSVAPGSSAPFPRCFHTFPTLYTWTWLFLICAFWLLNRWCVTWQIQNFPCLPLVLTGALKHQTMRCPELGTHIPLHTCFPKFETG